MYDVFAGVFLVIALALFPVAAVPSLTRRAARNRDSFVWLTPLMGAITWAAVTVGWLTDLALLVELPVFYGYAYFYGGLAIFLLIASFIVCDAMQLVRSRREP